MIDFLAGLIAGLLIYALAQKALVIRARRKDEYFGTKDWALDYFAHILVYDCPEEHAVSGELCDQPGVWVCLERMRYYDEMESALYDIELGIDEQFPTTTEGVWQEVEIQNDCGYGCKIYQHTKTGRRALAHNSAYGCTRSFKPTPPKE